MEYSLMVAFIIGSEAFIIVRILRVLLGGQRQSIWKLNVV